MDRTTTVTEILTKVFPIVRAKLAPKVHDGLVIPKPMDVHDKPMEACCAKAPVLRAFRYAAKVYGHLARANRPHATSSVMDSTTIVTDKSTKVVCAKMAKSKRAALARPSKRKGSAPWEARPVSMPRGGSAKAQSPHKSKCATAKMTIATA
jgi:hypothetical protein